MAKANRNAKYMLVDFGFTFWNRKSKAKKEKSSEFERSDKNDRNDTKAKDKENMLCCFIHHESGETWTEVSNVSIPSAFSA